VGEFAFGRINSKFSRIRAKWIPICTGCIGALDRDLHATLRRSDLKAVRHRD